MTLAARIKLNLRQKSDSAINSYIDECCVYKIAYNKFLRENFIPGVPSSASNAFLKIMNGSRNGRFNESLSKNSHSILTHR